MGSSHSSGSPTTTSTVVYASSAPAGRHRSQMVMSAGPSPRGSMRPELSRTGVIKNSVNVRKASFRTKRETAASSLAFIFDSSVESKFNIYFNCTEYLDDKKFPIFASELPIVQSGSFPAGLDQSHSITLPDGLADYDEGTKLFPIIIETVPSVESEASQLTYLSVNKLTGKPTVLKQRLRYGDRGYELHEIFGIERSTGSTDRSPASVSSETANLDDVNGTDCVICLSNPRDTTIIPCLHLCLCAHCAQVLTLNTRKCPVCRSPVTGMLQIDRDLPPPSPKSPGKALKVPE